MASGNEPSINVRLGTADDDPAIAALIAEGAPGNPKANLDVLRWQYRSEVFGPSFTLVAEVGDELVGHYSAFTAPYRIDGRAQAMVRDTDLVVSPAWRGRGIAGSLVGRLLDVLRIGGMEVAMSNTNDASLPTLIRRGWSAVGDPRAYMLPVDGAALARRAPFPLPGVAGSWAVRAFDLARRGSSATDSLVDHLPDDLDDLVGAVATTSGIDRSRAWWQWRYLDHPLKPYQIVVSRTGDRLTGLAFLSVRDDDLGRFVQILDLVSVDPASARSLVSGAAAYARARHAIAVVGAALPGSPHETALRTAGMIAVPRRLQPRPIHLLVVDLTGNRPGLATRRWDFSLGFQDHL